MTKLHVAPSTETALDHVDAEAERFFAEGEAMGLEGDSLSPTAADEPDEPEWESSRRPSLTPEQLARRARLRRSVAIGLTTVVVALVSSIGGARLLQATRARASWASARNAITMAPRSAHPAAHAVPRGQGTALAPPPVASADAPVASDAAPESTPAPEPSTPVSAEPSNPAAALRLAAEAKALLRTGRAREGIASARAAVDADPTLAEAYVLVAAALEDMGLWSEAHSTYVTCVDHTRSSECRYFAGRPR